MQAADDHATDELDALMFLIDYCNPYNRVIMVTSHAISSNKSNDKHGLGIGHCVASLST